MPELIAVDETSGRELVSVARQLMGEYAALPHIDGRWTTIDQDLAALPQPFVPPDGLLLLCLVDGEPAGCGALRPFIEPGIAEIKRVYVRPSARGNGVGELLMRALMAHAVEIGRPCVRLDTAPELMAARALYERLGFVSIPLYSDSMLPDTLCFEWHRQDR